MSEVRNARAWEGFEAPALPPGWRDVSWPNESAPCYSVGMLLVWLDHVDPAQRHDGLALAEGYYAERFTVDCLCLGASGLGYGLRDGPWDFPLTLLESDDWGEVVAFVEGCPLGPPMDRAVGARRA